MWNKITDSPPPDNGGLIELKCSDGNIRDGLACWHEDDFVGWMVVSTNDEVPGNYTIEAWRVYAKNR